MPRGPSTTRQFEITAFAPCSAQVGTFAIGPATRFAEVTPIMRMRPPCTCGNSVENGATATSTWPPSAAVNASPPELNDTTLSFFTSPPLSLATMPSDM